jgi:hypothetical protein
MRLRRPPPEAQLFFGPYDDAFPGPDSFNPIFRRSRHCAGCHDGRFWGVLVYGEFAEWEASPYAGRGVQCQDCHMKPDGRTRRVAAAADGGIRRRPRTVSSHAFPGGEDPAFLRAAVTLSAAAAVQGDRLAVQVRVRNVGAGHHVPTGSPMRNMVLAVEATGGGGAPLPLEEGGRVPSWAGEGPPELGNYAGLPGRGYAKVLKTPVAYPADRRLSGSLPPLYPAPFWRPVVVESDTRIAAEGEDAGRYLFRLPAASGGWRLRVRLIYRRTFRSWLAPEAAPAGDVLLAERRLAGAGPT